MRGLAALLRDWPPDGARLRAKLWLPAELPAPAVIVIGAVAGLAEPRQHALRHAA